MQCFAFIMNIQLNLTLIRYPLFLKLKFQSFLIYFFKKATTQFMSDCFQTTTNGISLFLI